MSIVICRGAIHSSQTCWQTKYPSGFDTLMQKRHTLPLLLMCITICYTHQLWLWDWSKYDLMTLDQSDWRKRQTQTGVRQNKTGVQQNETGVHPMADLDWLKIVSGVIKRTILILVTPSKQQWRYQNYVWWTERATASKSTAACFGRGLLPAGQ